MKIDEFGGQIWPLPRPNRLETGPFRLALIEMW